jgi:hypothetical protein
MTVSRGISRYKLHVVGVQEVRWEGGDSYSSPSIIRMIKSRRMRWAGHVERMGRSETRIGYWWRSQREKDH